MRSAILGPMPGATTPRRPFPGHRLPVEPGPEPADGRARGWAGPAGGGLRRASGYEGPSSAHTEARGKKTIRAIAGRARSDTIRRPDGSELRVECYGPADAPPDRLDARLGGQQHRVVLPEAHLADRFRLIVWDLPGLGLSKKPDNNDYRLENLAGRPRGRARVRRRPARRARRAQHRRDDHADLLQGLFPEALGRRVAGLVLVHTTYTNPVRTTQDGRRSTPRSRSRCSIPLLYLTIALWPLVWLMNWMSYLNGSAHRSTHRASFAGHRDAGPARLRRPGSCRTAGPTSWPAGCSG